MMNVYKTKTSTTPKKRMIIQQTHKMPKNNLPIKVLKRSKPQQRILTNKRNMIPTKLPPMSKKPSSITNKSIPSAYIQESSQFQTPPSTVINESLPPKFVQIRLPSIKDHTIKQNLTQKATLRCKTPRLGSLYSRSNTFIVPEHEVQTKTRQPLQRMDVGSLLSESARNRLKRLFNKLDTDHDGHLLYTQVQRCLPLNLPHAQLTFFHVLYDIISDGTYFGLQEFYATAVIVEMIGKQDSTLWNKFLDDVDFNYYHEKIVQLLEEFNRQCLIDTGTINYENLLQIIIKQTTNDKREHIINHLEYILPKIKTMKINHLDFLSLIPAIIYIESCFDHERALFRFRDNSILDLHMQRALFT